MKKKRPGTARVGAALWAAAAMCALAALCGCVGGTSTEAGNPSFGFESAGGKVPFKGELRLYAQDGEPLFFYPSQSAGTSQPWIQIGNGEVGPASLLIDGKTSVTLPKSLLGGLLNPHPELPLARRAASQGNLQVTETSGFPTFNVVVFGEDGTVGALPGVAFDSAGGRFHLSGEAPADTFWIRVDSGRTLSGTVDTAGLAGPPVALFIPGTPFYAQVRGDAFVFSALPRVDLPLRLVTGDGLVYAVAPADSLPRDTGVTLRPGARLDSIAMPPVLAAPVAVPPGPRSFTDSLSVSLQAEPGAEIRYTLNGNVPTSSDSLYTKPILLRSSATLKAAAFRQGFRTSPIAVDNYLLVPPRPIAAPSGCDFHDSLLVTLSDGAPGARIIYTLNGADPVASDSLYAGPLKLKASTTLKAVAFVPGLGFSEVALETYVLVPDTVAGH